MKRVMMIVAASIMATSVTALAAEHTHKAHDEKCIKECQMLIRNCNLEVDTIQQRISKLRTELGKGSAVYTAEELQILEQKLQDTQKNFNTITMGG
ncbi:MAG: hypothetical protein A2X58_03725 [Nitrospirae bacterium GWC2_56_14]|nr:MAG: hypothetical protein A2X58_03725 [Nitrospirae bacterium GWC2_56_14]